jgi:hypothetical protein
MTEIQPFPRPEMTDAELERLMRDWTRKRQQMKKALGAVMWPVLHKSGFTGTCPRFRRLRPDRYDLFMFDFSRGHDSFTIQVGQCAPDDIGYVPREELAEFFKLVPLGKLYPEHLRPEQRARVQPGPGILPADFFQYADAKTPEDYKRIWDATQYVPKGRAKWPPGIVLSRPFGTHFIFRYVPTLKRRAIFYCPCRDRVMIHPLARN